jgi:hypothetical protein
MTAAIAPGIGMSAANAVNGGNGRSWASEQGHPAPLSDFCDPILIGGHQAVLPYRFADKAVCEQAV